MMEMVKALCGLDLVLYNCALMIRWEGSGMILVLEWSLGCVTNGWGLACVLGGGIAWLAFVELFFTRVACITVK